MKIKFKLISSDESSMQVYSAEKLLMFKIDCLIFAHHREMSS